MPKRTDIAYLYDGSYEGFLCCVFESFEKQEIPSDILAEGVARLLAGGANVPAVDKDAAFARREHAGDQIEQCGFATAGSAQQGIRFAAFKGEIGIGNLRFIPESHKEIFQLNHRGSFPRLARENRAHPWIWGCKTGRRPLAKRGPALRFAWLIFLWLYAGKRNPVNTGAEFFVPQGY